MIGVFGAGSAARFFWGLSAALVLGSCGPARRGFIEPAPAIDAGQITASIILIGDAGGAVPGDPVLRAARQRAMIAPDRTVALFLGDVVYPAGVPDSSSPRRAAADLAIRAQAAVVSGSGARGIVVPGNHDWAESLSGLDRILRLQSAVRSEGLLYMPSNGCPGPEAFDIGTDVRIVVLDTQWWLFDPAEGGFPPDCGLASKDALLDSLRTVLNTAGDRELVVAAHHPLNSYGPHGGHFSLRDHVFPLTRVVGFLWIPLPVLGSAYPLYRRSGARAQDLSNSRYRELVSDLEEVMAESRPLVFAGGHEHNLQVFDGTSARYNLVSGAGYWGHTSPVGWKAETLFAKSASGFMALDFLVDGRVRLAVLVVDEGGASEERFSAWLN